MPKVVRCPNCHAPLTVEDASQAVIHCQYCGHDAKQTMFAQPRAAAPAPVQISVQGRKNLKLVLIIIVATSILPMIALPAVFCGMGSVTSTILKTATGPIVISSSGGPIVPGGGAINPRRETRPQDTEPEADRLLGEKLDLASECLNQHSQRAFQSRDRYLGWIPDPKAGPTCKEKCIFWGVFKLAVDGGSESCLVKLLASKQPPRPELDGAVPRYLATLADLGKVLEEAHRYYDQKDYKEDACKRGQELHARLMPLFEALEKSDAEIRAALERELPALWARRLKLVASEDGRGQLARGLAILIEARKLFDLIRDREAGKGGDGADAALRVQLARFGEAIDKNGSGVDGDYSRHPKWLYRVDTWVQRAALELQKVAKAYARGETRGEAARWERLPPHLRRHYPRPDALAQVREKYNDLLHHLRGSGPRLLVSSHSRCF